MCCARAFPFFGKLFGLLFYDYINVSQFLFYAERNSCAPRTRITSAFIFSISILKAKKSLGSFRPQQISFEWNRKMHLNRAEFYALSHIFVSVPNPTYQSDIYILYDNHISLLNYRCRVACALLMPLCLCSSLRPWTDCVRLWYCSLDFGTKYESFVGYLLEKQQHHDLLLRCVQSGQRERTPLTRLHVFSSFCHFLDTTFFAHSSQTQFRWMAVFAF